MASRNNINRNSLLKKLALVACMVCISVIGFAQSVTNKGKEFWVGYGHHQYMEPTTCGTGTGPNDMNMRVYLSNTENVTAHVTLTIHLSGIATSPVTWFRRTYNILPNTVIETENLPKGSTNAAASGSDPTYDARLWTVGPPAGDGGEGIFAKKGIHIESDIPIVAYAHIYGGVSSGATMLLPTEAWGYSYMSVNSEQGGGVTGCYSWMYVIAKDSNTVVEITPSQPTRLGRPAGVPFQITLQKGEIYQVIGQADCATGAGVQLTGTRVRTLSSGTGDCKPVAVFSGSSRTGGEASFCGASGRDNDMQQCYPQQAWGKRYLTAPFSKSSGSSNLQASTFQNNVFKIAVKDPSTVVKKNGLLLSTVLPTLTIIASATNVCPGTSVTFNAVPKNGGPTPSFQWKLNGTINVGTNSNSYTTSTLVNGDVITCVMTGSAACATSTGPYTSNNITMVVGNTLVPSVTIYSTAESLCGSNPIVFTAVPTNGGTAPTYLWKLNGTSTGVTTATYSLATVANNDKVTCEMISNAGCITIATAVTSNEITLSTASSITPSITITSTATTQCPITFTAFPKNGGSSPSFVWKKNGIAIPGATGLTYTTSALLSGDKITCELTTNAACATPVTAVASNEITVNFFTQPGLTMYATTESLCGSNPVVFTTLVKTPGTAPVYTWTENGSPVGTNSPTYSTSTLSNGSSVKCTVSSNAGCFAFATQSNTINMATTGLINNTYYAYTSSTGDYIEADKPIMVAQFMSNGSTCNSGDGDPEMVFLSPIDQAIKKVGFYRTNLQAINSNYITLIVPTGGVPSLRIDNSSTFNHTYVHPRLNGKYTVVIKGWAAAKAQVLVNCDSGFTAITYGMGGAESYAYNAGANLNNINGLPGYHNVTDTSAASTVHPYTYVNTPSVLGALIAYKPIKMTWRVSAIGCSIITPCTDTIINNPVPVDSVIIGVAKYYLYRLPPNYTFSQPGTYYLPIELQSANTDNGNCNNIETVQIEIIVKYKPTSTFTYNQIFVDCNIPPVKFATGTNTPELYPVIKWHWQFTSAPGDTSNLQNPQFQFTAAGVYPVKLSLVTLHGGIADTTIMVTVQSPPAVPNSSYTASATTVCLGQQITFTPTSNVSGTTGWYWNFGTASPAPTTVATNAAQNVTYTTAGTYIVRHTITGTGSTFLCPADTINKTIVVAVTPNISSGNTASPSNCSGINNGSILLNGLTPGASYLVSYVYNATTYTATIAANASGVVTIPSLVAGTYSNITVAIGSCTSNVVGPLTITNPSAPAAPTTGSNSPICAGNNLDLTAAPSINGGIYAWTGPNGFTSSSQNPTITSATTAATGTYSVTVTLNGCTSAAGTVNVTVNAIPSIGSTSSTNPTTCATNTGSILLNGLLSNTAYTVSYNASSGTQTATITSNGTGTVTIANLSQGTYSNVTVALNTCTSSAVGPFILTDPNPPATPVATTSTPEICEGSTVSLTASSSTAGVTYAWTGVNSFTSTVQSPTITSATTAASGTYTVTASLNGCTSAVSSPVSILVKPIPAVPTASSNAPICAGSNLDLTANGTATGATFAWIGPNSFTSSTQNPTITAATVAASGTYSVTASLNGCTSAVGTTTVAVNAIPAIGSSSSTNPTTCATATGSITLSGLLASTAYTVNYTTSSGVQTATITSNGTGAVVIANLAAGTYSNITVAIGPCVSSPAGPFSLSDPNPPATPVATTSTPDICEGASISLNASSATSGVSYNWTGPNSFTSAVQSPSISSSTLAATGTYSVTAVLNGCTSAPGTVAVLVKPIPATPTASSNTPICAGSALNLSATSTTASVTYAWTGPNSFTSSTQYPTINNATTAASGTYSVTASLNGCTSAAATTTATVNAIPAISSSSSTNPTTCATATGSVTLNGLLASTAYTVTYTSASGAQTATITSNASGAVIIPNLTAGTYSNVAVALNNCTSPTVGPFSLSDPNPPATPVVPSNAPICSGSDLNLTATSATAGVTYNWTGPNGFTSNIQNPTITSATVAASGTYSVTATLNSCTSAAGTTPVPINVKATPAVTSSSSTNPTSCASSTGSIVLNGLLPSTLYTVSYLKNSSSIIAGLTSNASGSVTIANQAAATYSNITVTLNGCTSTAVGPFTLADPNPPATPTASSNSPLCNGNTLNLTSSSTTAGVTYNWTGPNSFTSSTQNPSITNATAAASGTYNVTATLNSCTSVATPVTVVVNTTPNISSTSSINPANCNAATGSITLNGLAASTAYEVKYTKNTVAQTATISSNASGALTIPSLSAGTYAGINVTIGICPSNTVGPITLTDPAPPATPVIAGNGTLCEGSALNLTASSTSAGATFAWTSTTAYTATGNTASIPAVTVPNSGTYTVTATLNSCTSTATKTVLVSPYPIAKFDTSAFVCMPNGTTYFTNKTTILGNGPISYVWDFGDASPTSTAVNATHVYASSGSYTIKLVATSNGCSSPVFSLPFSSFYDKPIAAFKIDKDTICFGATTVFTDMSTAPNSTINAWAWDFGDGSIGSSIKNPTNRYYRPGDFTVNLTVKNTQGCASDVTSKNMKVYLQPVVDAGQSFMVPQGTTVVFTPRVNDSSATTTFAWTPAADFANANILRPSLVVQKNQRYTLTMTSEGGCKASDTMTVVALKKLGIPNAFSPNGDGINDKWDITNLSDYSFATVEIFNRYGQTVYKSYGYSYPWDGTLKGKPLPVGTYYYIIDFKTAYPRLSGYVVIIK